MICPYCKRYFVDEGRSKGGKNSKRKITDAEQRKMQAGRKNQNAKENGNAIHNHR